MALEVSHCCFCIELRTGALIVAYLNLLGNATLVMMSFASLINLIVEEKNEQEQYPVAVAYVVNSVTLVVVLENFLFSCALVTGLHKYRHKCGHVKAYLIFTGFFIVISTIMFIASIATGAPVVNIVRDLIAILLTIYFMVVIRSYYLQTADPAKRPAINNTA